MVNIVPYIKELLSKDKPVTIPGLGTFEWIYQSAKINFLNKEIEPPTCFLSFDVDKKKGF